MFRWPLPALLAWAACWSLFIVMSRVAAPLPLALALAAALGFVLALPAATRWRRIFVAAGFPLSLAASGFGAAVPAWAWLLPLGVLLVALPLPLALVADLKQSLDLLVLDVPVRSDQHRLLRTGAGTSKAEVFFAWPVLGEE